MVKKKKEEEKERRSSLDKNYINVLACVSKLNRTYIDTLISTNYSTVHLSLKNTSFY